MLLALIRHLFLQDGSEARVTGLLHYSRLISYLRFDKLLSIRRMHSGHPSCLHTLDAVLEITSGVQGLPCLSLPSQGKPCTPASLNRTLR